MQPITNIAIDAARKAGTIIARAVEHLDSIGITEKKHNDFVTDIDILAEKEIIDTIRKAHPSHQILAEESGLSGDNKDHEWIIDPLDGTTNFIHGFPHFAVSIAFRAKGRLEVGVIFDPIRDELFVATRGDGARLNNKRLRVSSRRKMESSIIGTGFPFRHPQYLKTYLNIFEALFPQTAGVRRAGSAALDLAYVAAGRLDGFFEMSLQPWDMAAGVLLIKEAGGLVSDLHGEENYLENGNIVAGNPKVFKGLLQTIKPCLRE